MRTRSINAVLITTLLTCAGCRTTLPSQSNDHKAMVISADALIYVHGAG